MNERIKELVKQAGGHFSIHNLMSNPVQHRESIELWDNNIEKFAELIVRECDRYARSAWEHGPLLGKDLLIHFGIEEPDDGDIKD